MIPEMQMLVALYPDAKSGDAGCFDSDVREEWSGPEQMLGRNQTDH